MTEDTANDRVCPSDERGAFLQAATKILSGIPKVASVLISFTAVAAVVGWVQARTYYSQFGASWLVSKLGTVDILSFSFLPIALLAVLLWMGITDLEEGGKRRRRYTERVLRYGWIFFVVEIPLAFVVNWFDLSSVSVLLSIILVVAYALFAGTAFEALVIAFRYRTLTWRTPHTGLIFGIVLLGLYVVPMQMGITQAKMDLHPENSKLPEVMLQSPAEDAYRLLLASSDRVYLVRLEDGAQTFPKIFVRDVADVQYIQRVSKKKRDDKRE